MSTVSLRPLSIAGRTCPPALSDTNILVHAAGTTIVVRDLQGRSSGEKLLQRFLTVPRQQAVDQANTSGSRPATPDRSSGSLTLNFEAFSEPVKGRERTKSLVCIAISPDGRFVIAGEAGQAPRILVWDLHSDADSPVQIIHVHAHGVQMLRFAPDSRRFVSIGYMHDGGIHVFGLAGTLCRFEKMATNRITCRLNAVAWIGDHIITLGKRHVKVWHCQGAKQRRRSLESLSNSTQQLEGRNAILGRFVEENFTDLVQLPDGRCMLTFGEAEVCLLDLVDRCLQPFKQTVEKAAFLFLCKGAVVAVSESGHLETLAVAENLPDNLARFQSTSAVERIQGTNQCTVISTKDGKTRLFFADGETMVLAGNASIVHLCEQQGQQLVIDAKAVVTNHTSSSLQQVQLDCSKPITAAAIFDNYIFAGSATGSLSLCTDTGELLAKTRAHDDEITQISVRRMQQDMLIVATASRDSTVQVFHVAQDDQQGAKQLSLLQTCGEHTAASTLLLLTEEYLISASSDRTLVSRRFTCVDGQIHWTSHKLLSFKSAPTCWAWMTPGELLVACVDRTVQLLQVESGTCKELFKLDDPVDKMAISGDLLCCSHPADRSVALRSLETGVLLSNRGHAQVERLTNLVWSSLYPDTCISTSSDGLVIAWAIHQRALSPDRAPPVRKPMSRTDLAKLSTARPGLGKPLRRRVDSPGPLQQTNRPLSPSKLGNGSRTPSPVRRAGSTSSGVLQSPRRPQSSASVVACQRASPTTVSLEGFKPEASQDALLDRTVQALEALLASHVQAPLDDAALARLRRATSWLTRPVEASTGKETVNIDDLMSLMKQRMMMEDKSSNSNA